MIVSGSKSPGSGQASHDAYAHYTSRVEAVGGLPKFWSGNFSQTNVLKNEFFKKLEDGKLIFHFMIRS